MGKLYVGNLPFKTTEDEVTEFFKKFGDVTSVVLIKDRETGKPRGFGFVEMNDINKAINEANGAEFGGRKLLVNQAKDKR